MQISPNSDPGDCLLDILVMTGPKSDSFTTLPKVYSGRAPAATANIAELRAAQLSLKADPGFPVEADGELLGKTPASFGIIPGRAPAEGVRPCFTRVQSGPPRSVPRHSASSSRRFVLASSTSSSPPPEQEPSWSPTG